MSEPIKTKLPLIKDYDTGRKSFTLTILCLGILAVIGVVGLGFYKMMLGTLTNQDVLLITQCLMFLGYGVGLYWRKRFKIGPDGLSIGNGESHD